MGIADQLQQTALFREVELVDLEALVSRMEQLSFPQGSIIFSQGDTGDSMYIIRRGRIRIYMQDQDQEITLTHYGENEIFGELSPLDLRPRSASASAAEDLDVLVLDRLHFLEFLEERPLIGMAMIRSLSQRLRNTTTYLEEYKPRQGSLIPDPTPSDEISRKAAQPLIATLIDEVTSPDTGEVADVGLQPPPPQNMGLFDRIAALEEKIAADDKPASTE